MADQNPGTRPPTFMEEVVDVESPDVQEDPPVDMMVSNSAHTGASSHQRIISDITFEVSPVITQDYTVDPMITQDYTVEDLQGEDKNLQAEGDVIEALERDSLKMRGSARSILMPQLSDDKAVTFEEETPAPAPMDPTDMEDTPTPVERNALRDLTAQLMTHRRETSEVPSNGFDGATRGTAADRMADTAEMLFKSTGELPDGVHIDSEGQPKTGKPGASGRTGSDLGSQTKHNAMKQMKIVRQKMKNNKELFVDFVQPRKRYIGHFWWVRFKFSILPGAAIAALLFYVFDNPPHGSFLKKNDNGDHVDDSGSVPETASVSWWILFIAVRQMLTFSSAKMWELFLVDFLAVKTRILTSLVGPYVSLWIAQAKGWPFQAITWGVANIIFLQGPGKFPAHWAFWQDWIDLFNGSNPSGDVVEKAVYQSFNLACIGFGAATAVKRIILSNVMGKRLVVNYGDQLENLMEDVLLVTQIAALSKRIARKGSTALKDEKSTDELGDDVISHDDESSGVTHPFGAPRRQMTNPNPNPRRQMTFGFFQSARSEMLFDSSLEEWDEPESQSEKLDKKNITIAHLLHFRRALAFIDAEFPFSEVFGPAKTRKLCVQSSQTVYNQLAGEDGPLNFRVFAAFLDDDNLDIDRKKLKQIWKLLRPSRDGVLTKVEFVKSIDKVYRNLRTLIASIESSSQIEQNYESIVNFIHYFILFGVGVAVLGFDFEGLLLSASALFVGIGFIIGNACSKFLEGLLMIFVQRPYDIGDRVSIGDATTPIGINGQSGWIVEKVNLYSTTLRFGATREVATMTNGLLAGTRIINLQRSKKAFAYINLKFGIDVTNANIDILKNDVKEYVDARPREWVSLAGFRMTEIQADLGYVAYIIVLQHRESWQNVGAILTSKAELGVYALERCKELGIRYVAPSVPVDVSMKSEDKESAESIIKALESKKSK